MPETCDQWAHRLVSPVRWNDSLGWIRGHAIQLRERYPEAWDIGSVRARADYGRDYYLGIVDALLQVRAAVQTVASHLNLSPIWCVPPEARYFREEGFITFPELTNEEFGARARARIREGRGTTDSAGTMYSRGGTPFLCPLSGWAPPQFWWGNRALVPGWKSDRPVDEARAREMLASAWQTMRQPYAPYLWWDAPAITFWPTAPISGVRWDTTSTVCRANPLHDSCIRVERAGAIVNGWETRPFDGNVRGSFMSTAPQPTPYLGPYASIRYAYQVLQAISRQRGIDVLARALGELAAWERGILLLGREELREKAGRTTLDVSSDLTAANQKLEHVTRFAAGIATLAATGVNPLLGAAVGVAFDLFFLIGGEPGSIMGARGYSSWPGRVAWFGIPLDDESARGMAPWPIWAVPPEDGMVCGDAVLRRGAPAGEKAGAKSSALPWIGAGFAAAVVAGIAIAIARSGR